MSDISVILASSIGFRNSGMFSVDYSAFNFFSENFNGSKVKLYVFNLSDRSDYPYEDIMPYDNYVKINKSNIKDVYNSDLIVYWSDFFHSRHFIDEFMEGYVFTEDDRPEQTDLFYKFFFLEGADDSIYNKTITFGNSLMFIKPEHFTRDDRYSINFKNFYSKIKISMPRDPESVNNLRSTVKSNCIQGCDPAFFLKPDDPELERCGVGVFIGRRSKIKIIDILRIKTFAKMNSLDVGWVDWMINTESLVERSLKDPSQAWNLFLHHLMSVIFNSRKCEYENDFTSLSRYSIVVTDTYHLCINAIKSGTPVFCIGDDEKVYKSAATDNCSLKKKVLFDIMHMSNCYGDVSVESLFSAINTKYQSSQYQKDVKSISLQLLSHCKSIIGKGKNDASF